MINPLKNDLNSGPNSGAYHVPSRQFEMTTQLAMIKERDMNIRTIKAQLYPAESTRGSVRPTRMSAPSQDAIRRWRS